MSWAKGIAAALAGTARGAAKAVEREDEKRSELTKTTLAAQLRNAEFAKELAYKAQEEVKAENQSVDSLMNFEITDEKGTTRAISRAEATAAYRAYGKNATSMLLQGQLSFKGVGKLVSVDPIKKGAFDAASLEGMEGMDGKGLLSKGRTKSIASGVQTGMAASGYSPEGFDIPQPQKIEGDLRVLPGSGMDKVSKESLYTDIPGISGKMITKVTRQSIDNNLTTSYIDLLGNDVTDIVTQGLQDKKSDYKLVTNFSDLQDDMNIRTSGMAFQVTATGKITPLNFDVVYTKDGGVFRKGDSGRYDVPVTEKNIMTLPSSIVTALGDDVTEVFDALGKTGRKAFEDFNAQAEAFGRATHVVSNQMELLNEHGNSLVADVGAFAEFKDYVMSNFGVALEFVEREGQQFLELDDGNRAILQNRRDQLIKDMETQTGKTRLATARRLYQANQILFAYASARAVTNDTRISNQDFDLFFKTVSGSTAVTQKAIYHNRLADAKIAVNEMYTSLQSVVDASGKESAKNVLKAIPESRTASGMESRITEVMGTDTPERTIQEVQEESKDIRNVYDKVDVRLEKVNPNTFQIDPNGVDAYVAYANGKRLVSTANQVVLTTDIANTTKDDLKREVLGMLQNKLIK